MINHVADSHPYDFVLNLYPKGSRRMPLSLPLGSGCVLYFGRTKNVIALLLAF